MTGAYQKKALIMIGISGVAYAAIALVVLLYFKAQTTGWGVLVFLGTFGGILGIAYLACKFFIILGLLLLMAASVVRLFSVDVRSQRAATYALMALLAMAIAVASFFVYSSHVPRMEDDYVIIQQPAVALFSILDVWMYALPIGLVAGVISVVRKSEGFARKLSIGSLALVLAGGALVALSL